MTAAGCILYLLMKKLFALGVSVFLVVWLESCSVEQKELDRHASPNQKLVAVLMESTLKDIREDISLEAKLECLRVHANQTLRT